MYLLAFPHDLCHLVLREWIEWRDLSCLDIAYLGSSRRLGWLTQISSLAVTQPPASSISTDDESLAIFYAWLFSRNVVACESFPVRLRVLTQALPSCPSTYSHTIRSIVIDKRTEQPLTTSDFINQLNALADFLNGCHHIESVKIDGKFILLSTGQMVNDDILIGERYEELLLSTIAACLGKNRLHNLEITSHYAQPHDNHPIHRLLINHVSTLRKFQLLDASRSVLPDGQSDSILEILSSHPFHLTKLILSSNKKGPTTSQFMNYLTSNGGKTLTELELEYSLSSFQINDNILQSIAIACPNLRVLALLKNHARHDEVHHLSSLFQYCPGLKRVTFAHVSIDIDDMNEIEITSTLKLFDSVSFNQQVVVLPYEGYEALFAILELPRLTKFELFSCEESQDADVNEILKKQLVWPSTFSWGVIDAKNCIINFDADRLLHPGVTMKHGH
eukprot:gene7548-8350_t